MIVADMGKFEGIFISIQDSMLQSSMILSESLKLQGSISRGQDSLKTSFSDFAESLNAFMFPESKQDEVTKVQTDDKRYLETNEHLSHIEDGINKLQSQSIEQTDLLKQQLDEGKKLSLAAERERLSQGVEDSTPVANPGLGNVPGVQKPKKGTVEGFPAWANLLYGLGPAIGGIFSGILGGLTVGSLLGSAPIAAALKAVRGGIATLLAPWVGNLIHDFTEAALADLNWDESFKGLATDAVANIGVGAMIGGMLFGKKGMLIGAVGGAIKTGIDKLMDAIGWDDMEFDFAGMSFDSGQVSAAIATAVAGSLALVSPKLVGAIVTRLGAVLLGPVGWVALAGTLIASGLAVFSKFMNERRNEMLENAKKQLESLTPEQLQQDLSDDSDKPGFLRNMGISSGIGSKETNSVEESLKMYEQQAVRNMEPLIPFFDTEEKKKNRAQIAEQLHVITDGVDLTTVAPSSLELMKDTAKMVGDDALVSRIEAALAVAKANAERADELEAERQRLDRITNGTKDTNKRRQRIVPNVQLRNPETNEVEEGIFVPSPQSQRVIPNFAQGDYLRAMKNNPGAINVEQHINYNLQNNTNLHGGNASMQKATTIHSGGRNGGRRSLRDIEGLAN